MFCGDVKVADFGFGVGHMRCLCALLVRLRPILGCDHR
jgi:hypothetical protein